MWMFYARNIYSYEIKKLDESLLCLFMFTFEYINKVKGQICTASLLHMQ